MNVIIIGRNYSSLLGMIRGAGMADSSVTVVRIVRKITKKKENDRFSVIRSEKSLNCLSVNRTPGYFS